MIGKMYQYAANLKRYIKEGGVIQCKIITSEACERYAGKVVCITGGGSGIGFALASKYISEGANVIIVGRDELKLKNAVKQLNNKATYIVWDICNMAEAVKNIEKVFSIYGNVDIWINNAGIYDMHSFLNMTEEIYDSVMTTNLKSVYFLSQAYIKYILKNGLEKNVHRILNIVSIRSKTKDTNPYGISKWGVECFTKGLASEARRYNILVNGISPGVTASEINGADIEKNAYYRGSYDSRVAAAEEIAKMAAFITSDYANHMIGEIVIVDGGETL